MLNILSLSALALALSSASAIVVPRTPLNPSSSNWPQSLEDYYAFHSRYLTIGCQYKHSDPAFFDRCCHPLPRGSKPDPSCETTSEDNGSESNNDCNDDDDDPTCTPSPSSNSSSPTPAPKIQVRSATDVTLAADINPSDVGSVYQWGGYATLYYQNGIAGVCGHYYKDDDLVAAMDIDRDGDTSQRSWLCGKKVEIANINNGKTVTVTIADACPTCKNGNSIDLSVGAFKAIATEEQGMIPIKWRYV